MPPTHQKLPGLMAPIVILFALISSGICILLYFTISRFAETFTSFGADLPLLTQLVLSGQPVFLALVLVIIGLAVAAALSRKPRAC